MNWSSQQERAVYEDEKRQAGKFSAWTVLAALGIRFPISRSNADTDANADANANTYANTYATAYADADAYTDAYADTYADIYADAYADTYADTYADAYADANADANADTDTDTDANAQVNTQLKTGEHMKNGFYFWQQTSGSVAVLRIGWLRRVDGDEYEALNQVTPKRNGDYSTMISDLHHGGPPRSWGFTRAIPSGCPKNRFQILDPVPLNPKQWEEISPRPKDWVD